MIFVEILKKSLTDNVVIKHNFLLAYNPRKRIVHAFFEGKTDESFYGSFLRRFKPDEWKLKTYICGNKDSVYYHFDELSSKHEKKQPLLFFVDKDIDDIIPFPRVVDEKIYVTDCYSIENYIVTEESIEQVWAEIFRQTSGTSVSDNLVQTFSKALKEVHKILLDIMSWVLLHRREDTRPNLDCIQTKDFFRLNNKLEVNTSIDFDGMISLLDNQTNTITSDEFKAKIYECKKELLLHSPKAVIRGHNEMDFFISFIKKLKEVVMKESRNKIKTNINITHANIIDIMGPRVAIPDGLKEFLRRHLLNEGMNV